VWKQHPFVQAPSIDLYIQHELLERGNFMYKEDGPVKREVARFFIYKIYTYMYGYIQIIYMVQRTENF
jgi:hypothetical protein